MTRQTLRLTELVCLQIRKAPFGIAKAFFALFVMEIADLRA